MSTNFTVTTNKGKDDAKVYTIDLGKDVLDGVSEITIHELATQSKKITIQSSLRKLSNAEVMTEYLQQTYPDATVTEGVVKVASTNSKINTAIKEYGLDKVMKVLEKMSVAKDVT